MAPVEIPYCAGCGYDLTGIGQTGHCPECGAFFDLERGKGIEKPVPVEDRLKRRLVAAAFTSVLVLVLGCSGLVSWALERPRPLAIGGLLALVVVLAWGSWILDERRPG